MKTPCDIPNENGVHVCPFADTYGGYEDEMCRNCCGLGVDEDPCPEEEMDFEDEEVYCYSENEEGELVPVYVRDLRDC